MGGGFSPPRQCRAPPRLLEGYLVWGGHPAGTWEIVKAALCLRQQRAPWAGSEVMPLGEKGAHACVHVCVCVCTACARARVHSVCVRACACAQRVCARARVHSVCVCACACAQRVCACARVHSMCVCVRVCTACVRARVHSVCVRVCVCAQRVCVRVHARAYMSVCACVSCSSSPHHRAPSDPFCCTPVAANVRRIRSGGHALPASSTLVPKLPSSG